MNSAGSNRLICALLFTLALLAGCNWNGGDATSLTSSSGSTGAAVPTASATDPQTATVAGGSSASSSSSVSNAAPPTAAASTATLSWLPPTTNTNGTVITDLAGYRIYYGTDEYSLNQVIDISNVGITTYVIQGLPAGTWYFAVRAYTASGTESALSNIASKTIA